MPAKSYNRIPLPVKVIFGAVIALFAIFLILPMLLLLAQSINDDGTIALTSYQAILGSRVFLVSLRNSFAVAAASALVTTLLAFVLAYTVNNTNVPKWLKKAISLIAMMPMLLPTITYGFAIIYSFGREGLITQILGFQIFDIYGFNGLMLGYVIYTIPIAFMLINNAFAYIDKKFMIVSRVLGDKPFKTFMVTTLKPLTATLGAAFIQSFFLSFTDFGIPASIGGEYQVVATTLYNQMIGSIPDFSRGAVVAVFMLIPSIFSILLLKFLERYNFRYNRISTIDMPENRKRDICFGSVSTIIMLIIVSIFVVIFFIPFIKSWPYDLSFSLDTIKATIQDGGLFDVYTNSLFVALLTAIIGTICAYCAGLINARSSLRKSDKSAIDALVQMTNTIPGMVLGIAFLMCFSGTTLQCTYAIIIICNILHYFSSPYLMIKNALSKMNASWETTGMLMGDTWIKTVFRVVIPNSASTIFEMLSYYFINSMVTISAVVFLVGARTMVITTKIQQLQHFGYFEQIFVLSLVIFVTNLVVKGVLSLFAKRAERKVSPC